MKIRERGKFFEGAWRFFSMEHNGERIKNLPRTEKFFIQLYFSVCKGFKS